MRKVSVEDFEYISKLSPPEASAEYYRRWYLDTHARFMEGFDAGFDQAVNTVHADKEIACLDCGSTNTVAYLTVHGDPNV